MKRFVTSLFLLVFTFSLGQKVTAQVLLLRPENELALLNASVARALELLADGRDAALPAGDTPKAEAIVRFLKETP